MSDPKQRSVLSRIVAAHLRGGTDVAALEPGLQTGLTRAIRRASLPYAVLAPQVEDAAVTSGASLQDALDTMPEQGLTAAVEDAEGRRGLVALDHPLVDALIEVQATGEVEKTNHPARKVTRIDEALCRDFLDLVLAAFAQETAGQAGRDWPDRMRYGSIITERAQLNLLMPERGYRVLRTSVTMGGHKTGDLVLVLPSDPAIARRGGSVEQPSAPAEAPKGWGDRMLGAISTAPMALDAVLMRTIMPLGKVEDLAQGDLVPFDHNDLSAISLEDEIGHVFARGALGQVSGRRAVRFGDGEGAQPAPAKPPSLVSGPAEAPAAARPPQNGTPPTPAKPGPAPVPPQKPAAAPAAFDPDAPMGDFDPDAPMGGFDPDAPMEEFDPNAAIG
ncbi:FliM/FliN family flagellar motor switch protein [Jannaschia sp. CCS1]|uniref:FliM/FliN family flagellar motor switch protein n=1 Tax=Jannaschia sp. (strain CCS1) TaxID=290400 RepID=UPI000053CA78|nr:FliM/FliN family flagellar motor C-terminal domain-containing protein [Jannaschia sp. CCS1]ABD55609.1 hypothetical protein Jann_2692 [Jannaschia sp. CCS1]